MSQIRYFDYKQAANSALLKELFSGLTKKSVLQGGAMGVEGTNTLTIAPVWVVFSSGMLMNEDEVQRVTIPTTSVAKNYTITYRHEDVSAVSGNGAVLALEEGFLENEDILNGMALGYVAYTGSTVPLVQAMIIHPPQYCIQALSSPGDVDVRLPPFGEGFMAVPAVPVGAFEGSGSFNENSNAFISAAPPSGHAFSSGDINKFIRVIDSPANSGYIKLLSYVSPTQMLTDRVFVSTETALDWEMFDSATSTTSTTDTAVAASLAYVNGSGGLTFTAKTTGNAGNDQTVQILVPSGTSTPATAVQSDNNTVITLATVAGVATSTMADLMGVVNGESSVLVTAVTTGSSATIASILATTTLAGGTSSYGFVYRLTNALGVAATDVFKWSFMAGRDPPGSIVVEFAQGYGSTITLTLLDTDGNAASYVSSDTTQTSGLKIRRYRITNGTFQAGRRFYVQASVLTAAGQNTLIASVAASTYRLPF